MGTKLEVEWTFDDAPETGVVCDDDELIVVVTRDATRVRVYAFAGEGLPAYREAMALDAWLIDAYGLDDDDERQELLDTAVDA